MPTVSVDEIRGAVSILDNLTRHPGEGILAHPSLKQQFTTSGSNREGWGGSQHQELQAESGRDKRGSGNIVTSETRPKDSFTGANLVPTPAGDPSSLSIPTSEGNLHPLNDLPEMPVEQIISSHDRGDSALSESVHSLHNSRDGVLVSDNHSTVQSIATHDSHSSTGSIAHDNSADLTHHSDGSRGSTRDQRIAGGDTSNVSELSYHSQRDRESHSRYSDESRLSKLEHNTSQRSPSNSDVDDNKFTRLNSKRNNSNVPNVVSQTLDTPVRSTSHDPNIKLGLLEREHQRNALKSLSNRSAKGRSNGNSTTHSKVGDASFPSHSSHRDLQSDYPGSSIRSTGANRSERQHASSPKEEGAATPSALEPDDKYEETRHLSKDPTSHSPAPGDHSELETEESRFSPPGFGVAQLRNAGSKTRNNEHGTPFSASALSSPLRTPSTVTSTLSGVSRTTDNTPQQHESHYFHSQQSARPTARTQVGSITNTFSTGESGRTDTSVEQFEEQRIPLQAGGVSHGNRTDARFGGRYNSVQRQTIQRLLRIVREVHCNYGLC